MSSIFLTRTQTIELNDLMHDWEVVVNTRDKGVEEEIDFHEAEKQLSLGEVENPNRFSSDEEDDENQVFSNETSEQSKHLRFLCSWANRALRSAKILRQSISLAQKTSKEKEQSLLKELTPPKCDDTQFIPSLTAPELSDDTKVKEYVIIVKKYRFLWRKVLSKQHKTLRSGFEYEQQLLTRIGSFSVTKLLPLLQDHLKREYKGADQVAILVKDKMSLFHEILSNTTSPSRAYLSVPLWMMYAGYIRSESKILDVITITPTCKSCTLFDFKEYLVYKEAISYLPTSITLIVACIGYLKFRLVPSKPMSWSYLPPTLTKELLDIHLEWIRCAGFHLLSKELWISAIEIHIVAKEFETARKLLLVVSQLPIRDVAEVLKLGGKKEIESAFPKVRFHRTVPSTIASEVEMREKFFCHLDKKDVMKTSLHVEKFFIAWHKERDRIVQYWGRVEKEKEVFARFSSFAMDLPLFFFLDAISCFSYFSNHLDYALHYMESFMDRIFTLLAVCHENGSGGFPLAFIPCLHASLHYLMEQFCIVGCFSNARESQLKLLTLFTSLFSFLKPSSSQPVLATDKDASTWLRKILASSTSLALSPLVGNLLKYLIQYTGPESHKYLPDIRNLFDSYTHHFIKCLDEKESEQEGAVMCGVNLWVYWAELEAKFHQWNKSMSCFDSAIQHSKLSKNVYLWSKYIEFAMKRSNTMNIRILYCKCVSSVAQQDIPGVWKNFLEFERKHGGNPSMTLRVLFSLVQRKLGDTHRLNAALCADTEKQLSDSFHGLSVEDSDPNIVSKDSPTLLSNTGKRKVPQSVQASSSSPKRQKTTNLPSPHSEKEDARLKDSLFKTLVSPAFSLHDNSLLALETLQRELMRIKENPKLPEEPLLSEEDIPSGVVTDLTLDDPKLPPHPTHDLLEGNNIPLDKDEMVHDACIVTNSTVESRRSGGSLPIISSLPTRGRTELLPHGFTSRDQIETKRLQERIKKAAARKRMKSFPPESPDLFQPRRSHPVHLPREFVHPELYPPMPMDYQNAPVPTFPVPPPLHGVPQIQTMPQRTQMELYQPYNPTIPLIVPASTEVTPETLQAILQDNSVLSIVTKLHEVQVLSEKDISFRRKTLLKQQEDTRNQTLETNEEKLRRAKSHREFQLHMKTNKRTMENLKLFAHKKIQEFNEKTKVETNRIILEQQKTLQDVGIPGFFPTLETKFVEAQKKVLGLLFQLAKRPPAQRK